MKAQNEATTTEQWKPIIGYEEWYDVSDQGRIRSRHNCLYGEKIMRLKTHEDGYLRINLSSDGTQRTFTIHSIVARVFIGPRPVDKEINHKDGNKANNDVSNIEYVTNQENVDHAVMMGLHVRGEAVGGSKLTESDVLDIWASLGSEPRKAIAKRHNVSVRHVGHIATREKWAWLTDPLAVSNGIR